MRIFAFAMAILTAAALAGCQDQPGAAPSSGPESGAALESRVPELPEPSGPAELEAAPGVEIQVLEEVAAEFWDIWDPELHRRVWDGHLLVEDQYKKENGRLDLSCFDLETGELAFALPLDEYWDSWYDIRPVEDEPGGFLLFAADGFRRYDWNGREVESYSLPEAAKAEEGYPFRGIFRQYGGSRWDVLPEKDLLAWCGPEGLWAAGADGEEPRLVLPVEAIHDQTEFPYFAQRVEELQTRPFEERVNFYSARLLGEGRFLSADFGTPLMQTGVLGHVVVSLADGEARWYDPYTVSASGLEYLDDTTILAGTTRIDLASGETSRAARWELTDRFAAVTGDFSRYYGVEETDDQFRLVSYDIGDRDALETVLTAPKHPEGGADDDPGYTYFYPSAVAENRVICHFGRPRSEGLLLVTAPEE